MKKASLVLLAFCVLVFFASLLSGLAQAQDKPATWLCTLVPGQTACIDMGTLKKDGEGAYSAVTTIKPAGATPTSTVYYNCNDRLLTVQRASVVIPFEKLSPMMGELAREICERFGPNFAGNKDT